MICPIETPSVSPWRTERTNERIAGVSQRASMLRERLVGREAHALLLQRQAQLVAQRPVHGSRRPAATPLKPRPASTVTTSRSISSGSSCRSARAGAEPLFGGRRSAEPPSRRRAPNSEPRHDERRRIARGRRPSQSQTAGSEHRAEDAVAEERARVDAVDARPPSARRAALPRAAGPGVSAIGRRARWPGRSSAGAERRRPAAPAALPPAKP